MTTNTVTQPVGSPQWKQFVRQVFVVAVLLVIGVGLGMAVGNVRGTSPETLPMEESAGSLAAETVAEHGEFTPLAYRDPSVVYQRFVGSDANLDPDVAAPEHGEFTSLAYRDPSVVYQRFVGSDANLDPDVGGP